VILCVVGFLESEGVTPACGAVADGIRKSPLPVLGGCPRISVSGFLNPGLACRSRAQVDCCLNQHLQPVVPDQGVRVLKDAGFPGTPGIRQVGRGKLFLAPSDP
jgi:hypothetical protein